MLPSAVVRPHNAKQVPYGANVDIRDTVNYKNVMKQYSLGPNGAILTSLNLFATRFDQVGWGWAASSADPHGGFERLHTLQQAWQQVLAMPAPCLLPSRRR